MVGKKQERKTRKIILHFLMKYDLNFTYGFFFFPLGVFGLGFYQNSLLEVMTLKSLVMRL